MASANGPKADLEQTVRNREFSRRRFLKGLGVVGAGAAFVTESVPRRARAQYESPHIDELSPPQFVAMYTAMLKIRSSPCFTSTKTPRPAGKDARSICGPSSARGGRDSVPSTSSGSSAAPWGCP